jgi:hypothetical protein
MATSLPRKIRKFIVRLPNLLRGFTLHVNPEKLRLIDRTFGTVLPSAQSFADLGGIWNVDGAYAAYTCRHYPRVRGVIVDTDIPTLVESRLSRTGNLRILKADFGSPETVQSVGPVDIVFFFDVLLHQANPDWDVILAGYARTARCIIVYNQQLVRGDSTLRLTRLSLEEYMDYVSDYRPEFYRHVFAHRDEIHPRYGKPWGDIHNLTQWGITDADLRAVMDRLGFQEVYYKNHGSFVGLSALENHAFIFLKR